VGSEEGGKGRPEWLVPIPDKDPGRKSRKRAATESKGEKRKSRRLDLGSPDRRTSAFLHSERLNEQRRLSDQAPRRQAVVVGDKSVNQSGSPKGREIADLPTELARVRRSDVEAEPEDGVASETETDKPTKLAARRNLRQVDQADEVDRSLLSKYYLPESIDEFLPSVIPGPDDSFVPPAWLMQAIEEVAKSEAPTPAAPPIRFDLA
jgi:hypothetical protein